MFHILGIANVKTPEPTVMNVTHGTINCSVRRDSILGAATRISGTRTRYMGWICGDKFDLKNTGALDPDPGLNSVGHLVKIVENA